MDGRELAITAGRERILLSMLLLHADRMVSTDRLVDAIWATEPPHNARSVLQTCVHRLRRRLHEAGAREPLIVTEPAGYRITVSPDDLDLHEFRRLVNQARAAANAGSHAAAAVTYRAALEAWRGPPLAGIDSHAIRAAAAGLDEELAQALEECIRSELAAGSAGELVAELTDLAARHPHREGLHHALMLALYRAGRQADALAAYRHARQLLSDDLGTEPSVELRQLQRAILNRDPALDAVRPPEPTTASPPPKPRELPPDVAGFTGRIEALKALDELQPLGDHPTGPVVISAIAGTAGVGKTALAVHWAHRVADRFPDGQMYVNLHGFDPARPSMEPAEALRGFLDTLQVSPQQIPGGLDAQASLYRSLLAGRRMLLVLDNARDASQVRPLLPGTPRCMVVVTSRNRLAGLVATDGANPLSLDLLTYDEAWQLLARRLGHDRLAAEPDVTNEIIVRCARLPLALAVVAARAATSPGHSLADLVREIRQASPGIPATGEADPASDLHIALDVSYRTLPTAAARLYRLLGLHPGPDLDQYAAAALLDATTVTRAGRLLDTLLDAHLLQVSTPGRYVFHDLIRVHATDLGRATDTEADRRAALGRLLGQYLHTASVAMDVAYAYERERRPAVPPTSTPVPELSDPTWATAWLDLELPNLLAAARPAAAHGFPEYAPQLSATLPRHLYTRGRYREAETLHHQTLAVTRITGDRTGEMYALNGLGDVHRSRADYQLALDRYRQALRTARTAGNRVGELIALLGLGHVYRWQGQHEQALDHHGQALQIARTTHSPAGELESLRGLGLIHRLQGRHEPALDYHQQALQIARSIGHRAGELGLLVGLGYIRLQQGWLEQALALFQQALRIAHETGHPAGELDALTGLGHVHRLRGRYEQAADHYQQALELARTLDHRSGELDVRIGLGQVCRLQGRYEAAADHFQQIIARELGGRNGRFEALQGLGCLSRATGDLETALTHHLQALEVATELRQPTDAARAHDGLAHAHRAMNQPEPAYQHWQQALDILVSIGTDHTDDEEVSAATIRAQLASLDGVGPARVSVRNP